MKRIILSITLAALTMGGAAQNTDSTHVNNDTVKVTSGNLSNPEFKGGQKALKNSCQRIWNTLKLRPIIAWRAAS